MRLLITITMCLLVLTGCKALKPQGCLKLTGGNDKYSAGLEYCFSSKDTKANGVATLISKDGKEKSYVLSDKTIQQINNLYDRLAGKAKKSVSAKSVSSVKPSSVDHGDKSPIQVLMGRLKGNGK